MELISLFGAGITAYCGWQAAKDELRCWRHYRQAAAEKAMNRPKEKVLNRAGYPCSLLSCSRL